jgi:hypothetical protein
MLRYTKISPLTGCCITFDCSLMKNSGNLFTFLMEMGATVKNLITISFHFTSIGTKSKLIIYA